MDGGPLQPRGVGAVHRRTDQGGVFELGECELDDDVEVGRSGATQFYGTRQFRKWRS